VRDAVTRRGWDGMLELGARRIRRATVTEPIWRKAGVPSGFYWQAMAGRAGEHISGEMNT